MKKAELTQLVKEHKHRFPVLWKALDLSELDSDVLDALFIDIASKYGLEVASISQVYEAIAEQGEFNKVINDRQYVTDVLNTISKLYEHKEYSVIAILLQRILPDLITLTEA